MYGHNLRLRLLHNRLNLVRNVLGINKEKSALESQQQKSWKCLIFRMLFRKWPKHIGAGLTSQGRNLDGSSDAESA
jgi:hypothetical protein